MRQSTDRTHRKPLGDSSTDTQKYICSAHTHSQRRQLSEYKCSINWRSKPENTQKCRRQNSTNHSIEQHPFNWWVWHSRSSLVSPSVASAFRRHTHTTGSNTVCFNVPTLSAFIYEREAVGLACMHMIARCSWELVPAADYAGETVCLLLS